MPFCIRSLYVGRVTPESSASKKMLRPAMMPVRIRFCARSGRHLIMVVAMVASKTDRHKCFTTTCLVLIKLFMVPLSELVGFSCVNFAYRLPPWNHLVFVPWNLPMSLVRWKGKRQQKTPCPWFVFAPWMYSVAYKKNRSKLAKVWLTSNALVQREPPGALHAQSKPLQITTVNQLGNPCLDQMAYGYQTCQYVHHLIGGVYHP